MLNQGIWYRNFGLPTDVLTLQRVKLRPLSDSLLRVRMTSAPINPSDLIPVTGEYRHRISLPLVAGYEGVGMVTAAQGDAEHLIGKRVLPIRGQGTWQRYVDCDAKWAVPVPDDLEDTVSTRGYINPLAAMLMLKQWTPMGKRVLLTAAGSTCATLLAQWALSNGATEVIGIHRSATHRPFLLAQGIRPVGIDNTAEIVRRSSSADLVFDAVGGGLATAILSSMRNDAIFVSYGLLSGQAFTGGERGRSIQRFHIRDQLEGVEPETWSEWFRDIWALLRRSILPGIVLVPLLEWQRALALFYVPGRQSKPVLDLR